MHICIISSFLKLDLDKDLASGGDKHILILAKQWAKNGNRITSISSKVHFDVISILRDTVRAVLGVDEKDFKNLDLGKIDTILAASPYPPDLIRAARIGMIANKKVHVYFHHIPPKLFWRPYQRGFFRTLLNRSYAILSLVFCKIQGIHIFLDQPQEFDFGCLVVHKDNDAIEDNLLEEIRGDLSNKENAQNKDIDIFFIGRISRNKGVINVVKAMKTLRSKGIFLNAVLAGPILDRRYYNKIKRYLDRNGMSSQVVFTGKISDEAKKTYLRRSKMFVFPSYEEGWSLSVMEAAAYCVPVVAFDLEAYSYLERNYFMSEPNFKSLSESILRCLTDKDLTEQYSKNAYLLVCSYSYTKIAEEQMRNFMNEF